MLNVLLESKAPRTRRVGGTLASTMLHGAIVTAAVVLTIQPPKGTVREAPMVPPVYIPVDRPPEAPPAKRPAPNPDAQVPRGPVTLSMPVLDHVPTTITPMDPSMPTISTNDLPIGRGGLPTGPIGEPSGLTGPPGEAIEARYVEKPPHIIGRAEPPRFPEALRARGQNGRIVVQFVVDTLGHAEMNEFKVVEATDAQLGDAVRAVLPRYRFSPGEAAGRKVRTLVALPFDFTVVR
jgi:protein TonB